MKSNIKNSIELNPNFLDTDEVPKPTNNNSINYKGKSNHTKCFLKHIRNSFAHGLLESKGNDFYIIDIPKGKENEKDIEKVASMIGVISKDVFYKLIEALLNTNPLTINLK